MEKVAVELNLNKENKVKLILEGNND
jgi:hypothetical protein